MFANPLIEAIKWSRNILHIENNQSTLKSELVYSKWNDIAMTVVTYKYVLFL